MGVLRRHNLEPVLTMADTVAMVEATFAQCATADVGMSSRIDLSMPALSDAFHGVMGRYVGGELGALGIRTARPGAGKLWTILFCPVDGSIPSMMDSGHFARRLTADVCGLAAK
jgi:hypothetical protein